MIYAPVLIPTLNRHIHLKRCIDSLSKCVHAEKTDLFVALDYPSKEEHWEGYEIIQEYLKTVNGFKNLTIIERNVNFGASTNFRDARETIFRSYDRVIISEDDNEFAPGFLEFINQGLSIYEFNSNVSAICGFGFPLRKQMQYPFEEYFSHAFSAWGYGCWRDKPLPKCNDISCLRVYLSSPVNVFKFVFFPYSVFGGLIHGVICGSLNEDRWPVFNNVRFNHYCLFPLKSFVRNHGFDGSGEHCHSTQHFSDITLNLETNFKVARIPVHKNSLIESSIRSYYVRYVGGKKRFTIITMKSCVKIMLWYFTHLYCARKWAHDNINRDSEMYQ